MITNAKKKSQNPLDYDPTRTTMLRRQFGAALVARLDRISRRITQVIEREDAFSLKPTLNYDPSQPRHPAGSSQGGQFRSTVSGSSVSAQKYQEIIDDVVDRFPKLKNLPPLHIEVREGSSVSFEQSIGGQIRQGESMYAGYSHGRGRIDIASDIPDKGQITLRGETVGFSKEIAVRHELGHHVQDYHREHIGVPLDSASGRRMSWQNTTRSLVGQDKPNLVSDYGMRSHQELFAESFAVYTDRQYVRGSLPKEIEHYFDMSFGSITANVDTLLRIVTNARWQFKTTPEQVQAFEEWIQQELGDALLNDNGSDAYWEEFIRRGYEQGAGRAFDDAKIKGGNKNLDFYRGKKSQFLQSAFGQPVSKERVQLLAGRTFTDLKGFTQAMATQMSRQLVDGLVKGESPRTVARRLTGIVGGNKSRALTIARTETIRAHAEGQLDALEMMGVTQIGVAVEWSTAKFNVCPLCVPLEGVVFSVKEARGMLPRHPNCRCAFLPANVGETGEAQQKKTKSSKQAAIDESIKEEIPEKSKRTLKEQKKRTSWSGADLKPEDAPKSILDD